MPFLFVSRRPLKLDACQVQLVTGTLHRPISECGAWDLADALRRHIFRHSFTCPRYWQGIPAQTLNPELN